MTRCRTASHLLAATAALALLAGCAVGPDFLRPAAPDVKGYTAEPLPAETAHAAVHGGAAQHFVSGEDIPGQWWRLFHSPPLDKLITEALTANPDIAAAQASLRQAKETLAAGEGAFFPQVNSSLGIEREKSSSASFGIAGLTSLFSVSTASVNVSYPIDIFGGTRRQVESLEAQAEYQRFQLEAAYLTLTSNVVTTAVQEASLRAQIAATQDIIQAENQQLDVLQRQFQLGGIAKAAVLAQQATLAAARANLPPLEKQLAQARNALSALAGRLPSDEPAARFDLASIQLPQDLPVSLPSKLVEQRPDVRAAEAQLHSASAQIGVATANMLPQITLTGSYGSTAVPPGNLFSGGTGVWSVAAGLAQPIFHGGELLHQKRAAVAAFDKAAAQYRSTVLTAFQSVADTLRALESDANALNAQLVADRSAEDSLNLARQQFRAGGISYLSLLDAERTFQQARINLVTAQANRYADTAALFQALGGGWWHRSDVALPGNHAKAGVGQ